MEFHVIDKRTGKEPIFDGNHIFRESWCKGRLIECDIDGWYISEDGQLALVDDCCNMAYPPPDRFEIVYDAPTVDVLEQIRAEIEKVFCMSVVTNELRTPMEVKTEILQIIDRYTK